MISPPTDREETRVTPKKFTFQKTFTPRKQTDTQETKIPPVNSDGSPNSPQVFENNTTFRGINFSPSVSAQAPGSPNFSPTTRKSTLSHWRNVKSTLNAVTFQRGYYCFFVNKRILIRF